MNRVAASLEALESPIDLLNPMSDECVLGVRKYHPGHKMRIKAITNIEQKCRGIGFVQDRKNAPWTRA